MPTFRPKVAGTLRVPSAVLPNRLTLENAKTARALHAPTWHGIRSMPATLRNSAVAARGVAALPIAASYLPSCVAAAACSQGASAPGGHSILNQTASSGAKGDLPRLSSHWDLQRMSRRDPQPGACAARRYHVVPLGLFRADALRQSSGPYSACRGLNATLHASRISHSLDHRAQSLVSNAHFPAQSSRHSPCAVCRPAHSPRTRKRVDRSFASCSNLARHTEYACYFATHAPITLS